MRPASALLVVACWLSSGCGSSPPPAAAVPSVVESAEGQPDAAASPEAEPVAQPRGLSEHACSLEGEGFDCTGCAVLARTAASPDQITPQPECGVTRDGAWTACPRVCCGLCPRE